jgi:hypothetical protein
VFELSPPAQPQGAWTETILTNFNGGAGGPDGAGPNYIVMDLAGNIFGSTNEGGTDWGIVFEIVHNADGSWTRTNLYSFTGGSDGGSPGTLVLGPGGKLYGAAFAGGDTACLDGCGVVFELAPDGSGGWTESVIHTFTSDGNGAGPSGLVMHAGKLYGTTGPGNGPLPHVIFELSPQGSEWNYSLLYVGSGGTLGTILDTEIVADASGNLYTGTVDGGANDLGQVLELSPPSDGSTTWTVNSLYSFIGSKNGYGPLTLTLVNNTIYGNSFGGTGCGAQDGCGTLFSLTNNNGTWDETVLDFDGVLIGPGPVTYSRGVLYGPIGQRGGWGDIFALHGF